MENPNNTYASALRGERSAGYHCCCCRICCKFMINGLTLSLVGQETPKFTNSALDALDEDGQRGSDRTPDCLVCYRRPESKMENHVA